MTLFPDGKQVAVVTSWDDGTTRDLMMAAMLDKYGYRGTFYICSDWIGKEGHLDSEGLQTLLAGGHEVGSHSIDHPHLEQLSLEACQRQLHQSKADLESALGRPVPSFAYPYGFDHEAEWVADEARKAGYASARTVYMPGPLTAQKLLSGDLLRLPVSAYFRDDFATIQEKWSEVEEVEGGIFHLWGHSAELGPDKNDWVDFECILGYIGGISNVWYTTVGDLVAHLLATR